MPTDYEKIMLKCKAVPAAVRIWLLGCTLAKGDQGAEIFFTAQHQAALDLEGRDAWKDALRKARQSGFIIEIARGVGGGNRSRYRLGEGKKRGCVSHPKRNKEGVRFAPQTKPAKEAIRTQEGGESHPLSIIDGY